MITKRVVSRRRTVGGDAKMQHLHIVVLLFMIATFPASGYPQPPCDGSALSDQEMQNIIAQERAARTDLPKPFPEYRSVVKRQGCHYVYIEYGLPETPEYSHIFKLNRHGVIIDVQTSTIGEPFQCPGKELSEIALAEIIKKEREQRHDLLPLFPNSRTRVERARCLYLYFEYALPETRGNYQVFTIDPFGEVMEFSRSQPY